MDETVAPRRRRKMGDADNLELRKCARSKATDRARGKEKTMTPEEYQRPEDQSSAKVIPIRPEPRQKAKTAKQPLEPIKKFHIHRRGVFMETKMFESLAFRTLMQEGQAAAMFALIRFLLKPKSRKEKVPGKQKKEWITDTSGLIFTYAEAKECGIRSSRTFAKVIGRLVALGFIDKEDALCEKDVNRFSLSSRWESFGTPQFSEVYVPRRKAAGKGFQPKPPLAVTTSTVP